MGKCIVCGCETDDFRCHVRTDKDGSVHDDYECEECAMMQATEARKAYTIKFNKKVLPYLLKNNFKVIVRGGPDCIKEGEDVVEDTVEEFPIKDSDMMYCVDIIRERMKEKGYYENWIDVHDEKYKGIRFEVVDYLCFALPDKDDEAWVSYSLEIVGENELCLNRVS